MPSRIIVIDGSGSLSFDVLSWLTQQNVPLIKLDWRGNVAAVVGSHAPDFQRVKEQLKALQNGRALETATGLIRRKITNCIQTLRAAIPPSITRNIAVEKLLGDLEAIDTRPPKSIGALLGIEGRAAQSYFKAWQSLPLRWKGVGRHPIPREWNYVGSRQSLVGNRIGSRNRRASHPVNAMLNYAYAILESQVRILIFSEGYDPEIGFLHAPKADRSAFVFDLMEPQRPIIDRQILDFIQSQIFHPADFLIRADGACLLNPEMARQITSLVSSASKFSNQAARFVESKRARIEISP